MKTVQIKYWTEKYGDVNLTAISMTPEVGRSQRRKSETTRKMDRLEGISTTFNFKGPLSFPGGGGEGIMAWIVLGDPFLSAYNIIALIRSMF